ncbi:hypothetical protein DV515_00019213, partial [Chloebia gouldiae]
IFFSLMLHHKQMVDLLHLLLHLLLLLFCSLMFHPKQPVHLLLLLILLMNLFTFSLYPKDLVHLLVLLLMLLFVQQGMSTPPGPAPDASWGEPGHRTYVDSETDTSSSVAPYMATTLSGIYTIPTASSQRTYT